MVATTRELVSREVASAIEELRAAVHEDVMRYFESRREVEAAALTETQVRCLNGSSVLVEGASVNSAMASHLRGAGWDVLHAGTMLTAKRAPSRAKGRPDPRVQRQRMMNRAGKKGFARHGLRYFNDTKSINWARKTYVDIVGATDFRYFPRFLEAIDNLIADSRLLIGLDVDDGIDEGLDGNESAPVLKHDGVGVTASLEREAAVSAIMTEVAAAALDHLSGTGSAEAALNRIVEAGEDIRARREREAIEAHLAAEATGE